MFVALYQRKYIWQLLTKVDTANSLLYSYNKSSKFKIVKNLHFSSVDTIASWHKRGPRTSASRQRKLRIRKSLSSEEMPNDGKSRSRFQMTFSRNAPVKVWSGNILAKFDVSVLTLGVMNSFAFHQGLGVKYD
jgi:hypothetical protein